jgi:MFS family permease
MAFLLALSFLTYFDRVCITRAQNEIKRDLAIDDVQMGLVMGAFWLAYALFEIPGGWLGDRYGARSALMRVVLMWSLFTALSGAATGLVGLLAFRFLFGVGEAGAYPNMARVQSTWLPASDRAWAGGALWLAARWGGAFSPVIFAAMAGWFDSAGVREGMAAVPLIGPALAEFKSWRLSFFLAGLLGVAWCVAFVPWFRDDPADKPGVNAAELRLIREGRSASKADSHDMPASAWLDLLSSVSLWAMAALYLCGNIGWSFFVSWMPKYFEEVHGIPFKQSDDPFKQPLFYGGLSCLAGGLLCDLLLRTAGPRWKRVVRAAFPVAGLATAAVAMYCVRFTADPWTATVLICVAGGAYDFGQGANWASIVDIGGRYAGVATGFINMLSNLANAVSPVLGAYVFGHYGWGALFAVYAGSFLAAASMWLFIDPTRPFHAEEKAA